MNTKWWILTPNPGKGWEGIGPFDSHNEAVAWWDNLFSGDGADPTIVHGEMAPQDEGAGRDGRIVLPLPR